jgi:hypothetical protein
LTSVIGKLLKVLQGPQGTFWTEAVSRPKQHDVEATTVGVSKETSKLGPVRLRPGFPIDVLLDNLPPLAPSIAAEFGQLGLDLLTFLGGDTGVEGDFLHVAIIP